MVEVAEVASNYSMETDISKLEAPTFSTIDRNQPASMLSLDWDHQVNLVGKKVLNPMIHCCDRCLKPILIYGRLIPCKHVFCLGCGKKEDKVCPRCKDKVSRVEQAGLGSIFLCTQGGSRYGNGGCRRTYLSSRDLQAHVTHRHSKSSGGKEDQEKVVEKKEVSQEAAIRNAVNSLSKASLAAALAANSGAANAQQYTSSGQYRSAPPSGSAAAANHISVLNTRQSNLITLGGEPPSAASPAPAPVAAPIPHPSASQTGPPPVHGGYVGGGYPSYATSTPAAAAPTYQPAYNQPPPSFGGYPGNYPSGPPPTASAPPYGSTGPASQFPPPAGGPPPGSYPPAPGGYGGTAAPPFQGGQWTRPPPGAGPARPTQPNHQNYYRR